MDQPFGYTSRPAIKQSVTHVLKCDWPIDWAEDQFYPENIDVSSICLSVYSFVGKKLKIAMKPRTIFIEFSAGFSQAILRSSRQYTEVCRDLLVQHN